MCRVNIGHLKLTVVSIGHLRATKGHLKATIGHLRVAIGVTISYLRVTVGYIGRLRVTIQGAA